MTLAEYIAETIKEYGAEHAFGIPGGVVLRLLEALERESGLTPHLNYHEQMAGFAACGYAQQSGHLGVAYATRGPGIANMITCIAEAWREGLPVLFITAHGKRADFAMGQNSGQELDFTDAVSGFTKYARSVETPEQAVESLHAACEQAMNGRQGPVFLDIFAPLFQCELTNLVRQKKPAHVLNPCEMLAEEAVETLGRHLLTAKRPIVLIGDGVRRARDRLLVLESLNNLGIPILSSRASQDILSQSELYYGYIGSHGVRYANYILSKADFVLSLGNSMSYPTASESFAPMMERIAQMRLDIDGAVFRNAGANKEVYCLDVADFFPALIRSGIRWKDQRDWLMTCSQLKMELSEEDVTNPVWQLAKVLSHSTGDRIFICDVGNNEFWFSRAFELTHPLGEVLFSKSFATLGSALGRAIGAHYASRKRVVCVMGDQGFQYNIQELQYIAQWRLPVKILLLNDGTSAMIRDHEEQIFGERRIHVDRTSGYATPDFKAIAAAYGIAYVTPEGMGRLPPERTMENDGPLLCEIRYDARLRLIPNLPHGNRCQNMEPALPVTQFERLERL